MNNLMKHAKFELTKAGMFDKDADYGGAIAKAVMRLVRTHAKEHHSGGSHAVTLQLFNSVINFKTLTVLTSYPKEWMEVDEGQLWQNRRQSSCFSTDGGKTWYDIDGPKSKAIRAEMALRRKESSRAKKKRPR